MKRPMMICAALCLLAGCSSSPENRYYLLSAAPPAIGRAAASANVSLASVRLPGVLDRPQLVVRTGAETVEIREFDRWAEPLADMVPRILAQDLALRAGNEKTDTPKRRLHIVIDEFMAENNGGAHLNGRWWIGERGDEPGAAHAGSFALTRPGDGGESPRVVAAMSALLDMLAEDIARGER